MDEVHLDDRHEENNKNQQLALSGGFAAIFAAGSMVVIKAVAYFMSGSNSILASLIDSITDTAISILTVFSIRYSMKPADEDHRHGHGKIEGVSALFQGAMLVGGALFLCLEALKSIVKPEEISHHGLSAMMIAVCIALTFALIGYQSYVVKKSKSLAIEADKAHYKGDLYMNAGVLGIVLIDFVGGPYWLDPLFALVVAALLTYSAIEIAKKAMDMLMDRELPEEERAEIFTIIQAHSDVLDAHDLRTNKSGMNLFISFDIELEPLLSLKEAHDIARRVELELLERFINAEIMIHMDPAGSEADTRHKVMGVHH
jgi:ferrous-iron efflux pump FieF